MNYRRVKGTPQEVFVGKGQVIVIGCPEEDDEEHNCDVMGCGSVEHIIFRAHIAEVE